MNNNFDKELAHNTFYKLIQTDRLHRSVVESFLASLGIHRSQHLILMHLSKENEAPSQKSLAEHFKISPAAIAVTLKKLEENGYILRISHKDDVRLNNITLTEKGKEIVEKSKTLFEETDFAMFEKFTKDDYKNLNKCLEKMTQGLNDYRKKH